jgi:hypothetical protein
MGNKEQWIKSQYRKANNLAWCSKCKQDKPQNQFEKSPNRRPFGLASLCIPCNKERKRKEKFNRYHSLSKEQRRVQNKKGNVRKFGISYEEYHAMLERQDNKCSICNKEETETNVVYNHTKYLAIDHCHETGKIRGLLCSKCNKGIGMFKEDISILKSAISYLEKYQ